jgi:hypothetical protein
MSVELRQPASIFFFIGVRKREKRIEKRDFHIIMVFLSRFLPAFWKVDFWNNAKKRQEAWKEDGKAWFRFSKPLFDAD